MSGAPGRHPTLGGLHRWLTNSSNLWVALGEFLAVTYALLSVPFPPGTQWTFLATLVACSAAGLAAGEVLEQRRLRTLRGVGDGTLPPDEAHLLQAAAETTRAPDVSFWLTLALMWGGSAVVALVFWALTFSPWLPVGRLLVVGTVVTPQIAVAVWVATLFRAGEVLTRLEAAGLPAQAVYRSVVVRHDLKRRLLIYGGFAALTPLLLVVDLSLSRVHALATALVGVEDRGAGLELLAAESAGSYLAWVVVGGVLVAVVVLVGALVGSSLSLPLVSLAQQTQRLAQGQYGPPRLVPSGYEVFGAASALATLELQMLDALGRLARASAETKETAGTIVASNRQHQGGIGEQQAALAITSATTEELARSARQIAMNSLRVSELAKGTLEAARRGVASAESFRLAIGEVRDGNQAMADAVVRLNKRVQQIGKIIDFIDGIADKSDLLAINAELEGLKAGEVGLGFSLVASEMRRLSESVLEATREIGRLIEEIRDATNAAVMATEAGVKATDAGGSLAQQVTESLSSIVEYARRSADALASISAATVQQQQGTDQLAQAMSELLEATRRGSHAADLIGSAGDDLLLLSRRLAGDVPTEVGR